MLDFENQMIELLFVVLHLFVFLTNLKLHGRNIFHPATLFSLVWLGVQGLHLLFGISILNKLYPMSIESLVLFLGGSILFSLGGFLINPPEKKAQGVFEQFKNEFTYSGQPLPRLLFTGIVFFGLPFYIWATYQIFLSSQLDSFFVALRTEISYNEQDIGPVKYLSSISSVCVAFNYYVSQKEKNKINRILLFISIFSNIGYSIFSTARTSILILLTLILGVNIILRKKIKKKFLAIGFSLFFLVFMSIGLLYGKGGSVDESISENLNSSAEYTGVYVVGGLNALDNQLKNNINPNYTGELTLQFFSKIKKLMGIESGEKIKGLIQEFTFIPYATNVYTLYFPYLKDFGFFVTAFIIIFLGALHTLVYEKGVLYGSFRYGMYFSFSLYPLFMSVFNEQYMTLLSTWIQTVFFIELFIRSDRIIQIFKNKASQKNIIPSENQIAKPE